jgi:hypothetical protein
MSIDIKIETLFSVVSNVQPGDKEGEGTSVDAADVKCVRFSFLETTSISRFESLFCSTLSSSK